MAKPATQRAGGVADFHQTLKSGSMTHVLPLLMTAAGRMRSA